MSIFTNLLIHNWRQFANVEINFHPRLTVLTGANGAGKTTILHLLNRHWGWDIPYVSTPQYSRKKRKRVKRYWAGFWSENNLGSVPLEDMSKYEIGEIGYAAHEKALLTVPRALSD